MTTPAPNPAQTTTQLAIEGMRKRAREESNSINVIYDDELLVLSQENNSADVLAQMPRLESIRSSLYGARHEHTPTLPAHRRDVNLSTRFNKTQSGEDFLLDDGDDDKILIFATEENMRLMSGADAFYIDGTFSTCPSLFYQVCSDNYYGPLCIIYGIPRIFPDVFFLVLQVFTIHILLYGHTFPMAYCLLPNKERHTYNRVFMLLKDAAIGLSLSFDPLVIVSDFELAMVQASTMSFQNSYHRGCYYHFMQAIWRKVCIHYTY